MYNFYGFYYKLEQDSDSMAFIVAKHRDSASLQLVFINDSYTCSFPLREFVETKNKKERIIRLGKNSFSDKGIFIDADFDGVKIRGEVKFSGCVKISGDIMGPFKYVPFMECRHMLQSAYHKLEGKIAINENVIDFSGGRGYTEGDCGRQFPTSYFWSHSFLPGIINGSAMLSVARIPYWGISFTGVIGFVMIGKTEHRIATYKGARVTEFDNQRISVKQGKYLMTVELIDNNRGNPLSAPQNRGEMGRTIYETLRGQAILRLSYDGKDIYNGMLTSASYEYEI